MQRTSPRPGLGSLAAITLLALAAAIAIGGAACGDLVIPKNSAGDDGGAASGDDDSAGDDDVSVDARPPPNCDAGVEPVALSCTGLYSDWTQLTVAPDVQPFTPGASMWADGADSSRWIWLPPGSTIDTTHPDGWVFPVGTKLWQELRLLGTRVETRFSWKEATGLWFRTTFAWTADQSAAPALTLGVPNARGLPYEIPATSACGKCHDGAADFVLGFEAVGLSLPTSAGLNLAALQQKRLLSKALAAHPTVPGDPATSAALVFLHANCGTSCHNRGASAGAGATGLYLKLTVDAMGALPATAQATDTWITSYKVPSQLTPYGYEAGGFWRIAPGDGAHSSILWTISRRDGVAQMPPIASHLVDQNDVQRVSAWIGGLSP
jgi:hypothetical protein